jgi:predicted O-methyltransferase YrrM
MTAALKVAEKLLLDRPAFHNGSCQGISRDVALYLDAVLQPGWTTLETGSGLSTVLFAVHHCLHRCIFVDPAEAALIQRYCECHGIAVSDVQFTVGRSEEVLPILRLAPLDFVLIDGRHAFPTPFLDWYYTAPAIKQGGLLLVDDTHIWTGKVLLDFLMGQREWQLAENFGRAASFIKTAPVTHVDGWNQQRYVRTRSKGDFVARMSSTISLLRRGKFRELSIRMKTALERT